MLSHPRAALSWLLADSDLPALTGLAAACLSVDGGQPFAASPDFLRRTYLSGAETYAGFGGAALVCVSSLRRAPAGTQDEGAAALTTGLVHPAWRRRGLGGHAFDWAANRAGPGAVRAETEALSEGADALYLSKGLEQVFAEDVMQLAASARPPEVHAPADLAAGALGRLDQRR